MKRLFRPTWEEVTYNISTVYYKRRKTFWPAERLSTSDEHFVPWILEVLRQSYSISFNTAWQYTRLWGTSDKPCLFRGIYWLQARSLALPPSLLTIPGNRPVSWLTPPCLHHSAMPRARSPYSTSQALTSSEQPAVTSGGQQTLQQVSKLLFLTGNAKWIYLSRSSFIFKLCPEQITDWIGPPWDDDSRSAGQKFFIYYRTRRFITTFKNGSRWTITWAKWFQPTNSLFLPSQLLINCPKLFLRFRFPA